MRSGWWRWALVPVAAWIGWVIALGFGGVLVAIADGVCPANQVVSDHHCVAPWYDTYVTAAFCVGAGIAAVLIVALTAFVAPAHRSTVATVAFGIGGLVAVGMAVSADAWGPGITAIIAGAITLLLVRRRLARPATNRPAQA